MLDSIAGKLPKAASLVSSGQSLLDVGCRGAELRAFLPVGSQYTGIDLIDGHGVDVVANVEAGLPFPDRSFDVVAALDLLEHTNDIWFVRDELLRVARQTVLIQLPNCYYWQHRLNYLRGREMNKYVLPAERILDRHRWLTSRNTAAAFCAAVAAAGGWTMREVAFGGPRWSLPIDSALMAISRNAATYSSLFVLDRILP